MATLYNSGSGNIGGTFDSILKEFYIGPVQEQLNNEVFALEMFEKAVVDWNGKHCIIPVHTARNSGVEYLGDGDSLSGAGSQTYESLTVKAKFLYGQFAVTGPAISAAKKGSSNSFISYVDAEMTSLVNDVRDAANKSAVSGGRVKGFICTREVTLAGHGSGNAIGTLGAGGNVQADVTLTYDGDFSTFSGCANGDHTTWIEVDLINCATGLSIKNDAANDVFFITDGSGAGFGEVAGALQIGVGKATSGYTQADIVLGTAVDAPHAIAVVLKDTLTVAGTGKVLGTTAGAGTSTSSDEVTGIYGNLADPSHFGVTRTNASNTALMSTVQTSTTDDTVGRVGLTVKRMQQMFDECLANSGDEPDAILMHPLQRSIYVGLLGTNLRANVGDTLKGSAGFTGLEFNGIPIHTSRHVSNGMVIFLSKASWKLCELEPGGFADLDGNVLSRSADKDQYNGYYRWYWNLVCTKPGANAILCGSELS